MMADARIGQVILARPRYWQEEEGMDSTVYTGIAIAVASVLGIVGVGVYNLSKQKTKGMSRTEQKRKKRNRR